MINLLSDRSVTKNGWGAFCHSDLDADIRDKEVTQVVIAGDATTIGVESTALG